MEAKVIKTGEIVKVEWNRFDNDKNVAIYKEVAKSRAWTENELYVFGVSTNWEKRRFELVKAVVQGMASHNPLRSADNIVSKGIEIADAVIEKLKEE